MKRPADLKESFDFCGLEDENYVSVSYCFAIKIKFFLSSGVTLFYAQNRIPFSLKLNYHVVKSFSSETKK